MTQKPSSNRFMSRLAFGLLAASALVVAACSPIKRTHGYTPRAEELARVQVGVDTRETVMEKLGRPSTLGTFDSSEWYYISQQTEALAFYAPEIVDRSVVTVSFDETAGTVSDVGRYGLEDGRVVDLVTRTTPTAGAKLTLLQQIFANLGRFNAANASSPPRVPGR